MSEADDVLLGRAELERAFTALGERLARRGVVADVFVVGGAAMALAYDATRVTGMSMRGSFHTGSSWKRPGGSPMTLDCLPGG
jgi:hypothetical protein